MSHEIKCFAHTDCRTSPLFAVMLRIPCTQRELVICRIAGKTARMKRLASCSSDKQYRRSQQMGGRRCRTRQRPRRSGRDDRDGHGDRQTAS